MVKPTVCRLRRDSNRVFTLSGIADEAKPALVEGAQTECEPALVGTNAPV
jgi:hypothetical protein